MKMFEEWCEQHVPEWLKEHRSLLYYHDATVSLVSDSNARIITSQRRPPHHTGVALAVLKKEIKLLAAAVLEIGPYLPAVHVNEQGAWMASCGKDVLQQSIEEHSFSKGTLVAVRHKEYIVALGTVLEAKQPQDRAVRLVSDVGQFLHN